VSSIFVGWGFLLRGWREIFARPRLLIWLVFPLCINAVLSWALFFHGWQSLGAWTTTAVGFLLPAVHGVWATVTYHVLFATFAIGFFFVGVYILILASTVLNAPFYNLMVEQLLLDRGYLTARSRSFAGWAAVSWRMLGVSLRKLLLFGALGVCVFLASFVPVLNIFAGFVGLMMVAFDCADYTFENLEWGLGRRVLFFLRNILVFVGMGLILGLPALIPGALLLLMPGAVAGAAVTLGPLVRNSQNHEGTLDEDR
jgi:CysZ protein